MTEIIEATSLALLTRAELDQQVSTAKAYPRSVAKFKAEALAMATLDQDTAASCFYSLPRGGKAIEGPSIRLAEIIGSAWGNLNYGARIVDIGDKFITAQGICRDLERNVSMTAEVTRSISGKSGRFNQDMIAVTCNAACAIALRNAIFKVVPMAYAKDVLAQARKVAIGDAKTLGARRTQMIEYFGKMGVEPKRILWLLDKPSIDDVNLEDMQVLVGLSTAIKDGDTTIEDAFPIRDPKAIDTPAPANAEGATKAERAVAAAESKKAKKSEKAAAPEPQASIPPETPPVEPVAATVVSAPAPALSYAERLQALMFEAGYDGPLSRKQMAGLVKLDDTRLVDAMAGKCVLTADELTKLEGVGVNVKGLA